MAGRPVVPNAIWKARHAAGMLPPSGSALCASSLSVAEISPRISWSQERSAGVAASVEALGISSASFSRCGLVLGVPPGQRERRPHILTREVASEERGVP